MMTRRYRDCLEGAARISAVDSSPRLLRFVFRDSVWRGTPFLAPIGC